MLYAQILHHKACLILSSITNIEGNDYKSWIRLDNTKLTETLAIDTSRMICMAFFCLGVREAAPGMFPSGDRNRPPRSAAETSHANTAVARLDRCLCHICSICDRWVGHRYCPVGSSYRCPRLPRPYRVVGIVVHTPHLLAVPSSQSWLPNDAQVPSASGYRSREVWLVERIVWRPESRQLRRNVVLGTRDQLRR